MTSTNQRGTYYKNKTRDWFNSQGYTTQLCEFVCGRMIGPGRIIYQKKDVFASDGISMNGKELIFWNSKHCTSKNSKSSQISSAKKEYAQFPFPKGVKVQIIMWTPRVKQPEVIDCQPE